MAQFCRVTVSDNLQLYSRLTYSADDFGASSTFANHVSSAVGCLCRSARDSTAVHVDPIGGRGLGSTVAECFISIDGGIFVHAAQGGSDEDATVLDEAIVDGTTCSCERIEGCEIDGGDDADDDAAMTRVLENAHVLIILIIILFNWI